MFSIYPLCHKYNDACVDLHYLNALALDIPQHPNTSSHKVTYSSQRSMQPARLLQRLPPTKLILGLVGIGEGQRIAGLGLSISDPYLSFATPLEYIQCRNYNDHAIPRAMLLAKELGAGAVVIGLPVNQASDKESEFHQRELVKAFNAFTGQSMPFTISDLQTTVAEARATKAENVLWEDLCLDRLDLPLQGHLHAGVALQLFLDVHGGGWRNTFG